MAETPTKPMTLAEFLWDQEAKIASLQNDLKTVLEVLKELSKQIEAIDLTSRVIADVEISIGKAVKSAKIG